MHLTQWTDYALRVLMYCAAYENRDQPVTISEIAQAHRRPTGFHAAISPRSCASSRRWSCSIRRADPAAACG